MKDSIQIALPDFSPVVPKAAANPDGFARIFGANGEKDASKMDAKSSDVISSEVLYKPCVVPKVQQTDFSIS